MTIMEYLQSMSAEERAVKIGCVDNALKGLRGIEARDAARASCKSWACPDYLAQQIGVAFECKHPYTAKDGVCERCAAAFLSMRMPNTGRRREHGRE